MGPKGPRGTPGQLALPFLDAADAQRGSGPRRQTTRTCTATVAREPLGCNVHPDVRRTLAIVAEIMLGQHRREVAAAPPEGGTMSANRKGHARANERDPESQPCEGGPRPMAKSTRPSRASRTTDPKRAA